MTQVRLAALALLAATVMAGCLFDECGETVKLELVSPSEKYVATVVELDCGATTDFSTSVFLRESSDDLEPSAMDPAFTVKGQAAIGLEWTSDGALTITNPGGETFAKLTQWKDVRLSYR